MKKVILSLALLAAVTSAANAQVQFGLKAGGSLTTLATKDEYGYKSKLGGHAGVFASFGISDMFSVQPELLYSMKGTKSEVQQTFPTTSGPIVTTINGTQSLNYLDIPVMVKVSTGDNNSGFFFEVGPQLGVLLTANSEAQSTNPPPGRNFTGEGDNKNRYNTVDVGYAVGLGYQLELGPLLGFRYNGGITDIIKNNTGNASRNDAFQLYAGFRLGGQ